MIFDKIFFPKNRAPGKTGISREPRNFRDFFSWFFPEILYNPMWKKSKIDFVDTSCSEAWGMAQNILKIT